MAEDTGIEWTDHSYNPWVGCVEVSPGCANCYARVWSKQKKYVAKWGHGAKRQITKTAADPEKWNLEAGEMGTRYTVFCASMSDIFEDHVALPPVREDLWRLIKRTPFLNWMILTKREENIAKMLPKDWGNGYENVCLMVSVENQEFFDKRVPALQNVKAKFRALSVEPLLGPLKITPNQLQGIDLLILGGESGRGKEFKGKIRPLNPDWVRHIRDVCAQAGVKFFFKQWGNFTPDVAYADKALRNGLVFENYSDAKPKALSLIKDFTGRQAAIAVAGAQVVFPAKSKKGAGSSIDGREHKDHLFQIRPKDAQATPCLAVSLTTSDKADFKKLESVVETGLESFWKAGEALRQIRDRGLYRETHGTFEAYCLEKWEMSRAEAYRQIGAAAVIEDINTASPALLPLTASQTRPLQKLKTAHERREAWATVTKEVVGAGKTLTAQIVANVVAKQKAAGRKPKKVKQGASEPVSVKDKLRAAFNDLNDAIGPSPAADVSTALKRLTALLKQVD